MSKRGKSIKRKLVVARGWREGEWKVTADGYAHLFGVMKRGWNQIVGMAVQLCEHTRNHQIVHFERVNFMWIISPKIFF